MMRQDAPSSGWAGMDAQARKEFWASLALRHCKGLGALSAARLLQTFGSAHAAFQARDQWHKAGLHRGQVAEMATGSWRVTARAEWEAAQRIDARILLWHDSQYPERLRTLPDAPVLLYCKGDLELLSTPAVAVIGTRQPSPHARTVAVHMARNLSACGICVVSGMAQGIDGLCHSAALARVGKSIGVLGTGIGQVYPRTHQELFARMRNEGLLVSEFAPGSPPLPQHFPIRNRIISGLALAVVVVEAASRSGSLITARLAAEQGREVYAVPGPALDEHCTGCQDLVRQGAKAVFDAEDVIYDLLALLRPYGIPRASLSLSSAAAQGEAHESEPLSISQTARHESAPTPVPSPVSMGMQTLTPDDSRAAVLQCLHEHGPLHLDGLADKLGMSAQDLNSLLLGLELMQEVRRLPGARYEALV